MRPFLPVLQPNVPGPNLPPRASPGLELLPPSSFMPRGVGGTTGVSPLQACHSLSFGTLPLTLEFLGHSTSLGALHTRPKT